MGSQEVQRTGLGGPAPGGARVSDPTLWHGGFKWLHQLWHAVVLCAVCFQDPQADSP